MYDKELSKVAQECQCHVMHEHVKKSDVVITTALIPGKPAPLLVTEAMVADMQAGSVIIDLAAENGGNCALTEAGKTVIKHGVKIVGPINIPSQLSSHASLLYAKNMLALLKLLIKEGELDFDMDDEIILNTTITKDGEVVSPLLQTN